VTCHFQENIPEDNDGEVYAKYHAFVLEEGYGGRLGVFESAWDEMLPLNVIIDEGQTPDKNDVIVSVIWELTWKGATAKECKKAWHKYFKRG
jgi:hypothetical protein